MAFADSVPGVSGGTIAYILGQYDSLISSIHIILSNNSIDKKKEAFTYLTKLLLGWISGFVIAVLAITELMITHTYQMTSLFLGFIIFSIGFIIIEEFQILKKNKNKILYLFIGALIVILIAYFSSTKLDILQNSSKVISYIYIFIAGIIAISAMLLPGISGSTLLIIFGLYSIIMQSIKSTIKFDFSNLFIVIVFGLGLVVGLKYTSKIISKALEKYKSMMIYLIIGLMLGSIYAIIIGPTTLTDDLSKANLNYKPLTIESFSLTFFIIGILITAGLDRLKTFIKE